MEQIILRELQLTELEILKKVHAICEENHLIYYLVGGTLLGAIRHGGFIPWDDDLDIAMPRDDYNRFIKICINGGLGEGYYLHHSLTDIEYWLPFAKIKKNNTLFEESQYKELNCHKGIFIDIFPLDYCRKDYGIRYNFKAKLIKKLSAVIQMRKLGIPSPSKLTSLMFFLTRPLRIGSIAGIRDSICVGKECGKYIINYSSNYKYQKQTMPREFYEPCVRVKFEDGEFYAPNQYVSYLRHLFNNWKQLPPETERRNHNPATIVFDLERKEN